MRRSVRRIDGLRRVHLATGDGVGIELFQFANPKSERREDNFEYWKTGIFHICLTDPEIETLAKRIDESGGKQRSKVWKLWPDNPTRCAIAKTRGAISLNLARTATSRPGRTTTNRTSRNGGVMKTQANGITFNCRIDGPEGAPCSFG